MVQCELLDATDADALARQAHARPDLAMAEHRLVMEMRDDTYDALNGGGRPNVLQDHLTSAHASSRLQPGSAGRWRWAPASLDLATPRHRLALELLRLLTSDSVVQFHRCEDRHCGWVFLDTSRQHNRRWCSSADCGNRNRVRAHYARSKSDPRRPRPGEGGAT
jgi:predicted RNA-binding Zn ribbon-like protein